MPGDEAGLVPVVNRACKYLKQFASHRRADGAETRAEQIEAVADELMQRSKPGPSNRSICPACGERAVSAIAVDDPFFGLDLRYPGLECESCEWGSP